MTDEEMLARAVAEARQGLSEGGIPIGAVLGTTGKGGGHNRRVQQGARSGTARPTAWRTSAGCRRASTRVDDGHHPVAVRHVHRRDPALRHPASWGENRNFVGGEALLASRGVEVVVLDDAECVEMMASFIAENPTLWNEDIGVEDEAAAPAGLNASAGVYAAPGRALQPGVEDGGPAAFIPGRRGPRPRVGRGRPEVEAPDRRLGATEAGDRAEDQLLVQLVPAVDAADQVGVLASISRGPRTRRARTRLANPGANLLDPGLHPVGEALAVVAVPDAADPFLAGVAVGLRGTCV